MGYNTLMFWKDQCFFPQHHTEGGWFGHRLQPLGFVLPKKPTAQQAEEICSPLFLKLETSTRQVTKDNMYLTRQPNLIQRKQLRMGTKGRSQIQRCCPNPSPADLETHWGRAMSYLGFACEVSIMLLSQNPPWAIVPLTTEILISDFILCWSIAVSGRNLPLSLFINQFSWHLVSSWDHVSPSYL